MIEATDLAVAFDGEPVLTELSLGVDSGEVLAVIGPSGVGKTTLLRLLALARAPDGGTVRVDGVDAWAVDAETRLGLRRRIGMVFQQPSLFAGSVAENVGYGLRVRRDWDERLRRRLRSLVRSPEPPAVVREALELVGMGDRLEQTASSLSGGEAQRVAFARALAYEPAVLLLDEPTSDLDPRNTAVIESAVGAAADRGIGVVVATHDMHQAERVADRVAVLLGGTITEVGPTAAVFDEPAEERTRKFIAGELVY